MTLIEETSASGVSGDESDRFIVGTSSVSAKAVNARNTSKLRIRIID
jgi:hypothetical protein